MRQVHHSNHNSKDMNRMESTSDAMEEFDYKMTDRSQQESSISYDFLIGKTTGYLPLVHA